MIKNKKKYVILDLDDTLINTSDVYWQARSNFVNLLVKENISESFLLSLFESIEKENLNIYKFSPYRYQKSMLETYKYIVNNNLVSFNANVQTQITNIGCLVYKSIPHKIKDSDTLLEFIKNNYTCFLVTRGAEWFQLKKVLFYKWEQYFKEIIVVDKKDELVFSCISNYYKITPEDTWVIGDSIKSDINPGLSLGMDAILYKYKHPNYRWLQEYDFNSNGEFYVSENLETIIEILKTPERFERHFKI